MKGSSNVNVSIFDDYIKIQDPNYNFEWVKTRKEFIQNESMVLHKGLLTEISTDSKSNKIILYSLTPEYFCKHNVS